VQNKKQKVYVAMSGGVDSSVAAALLKQRGFRVVGVYMKCWIADDPLYKGCTALDDERSARLAASHLGISFYTWNFIKEYRQKVVEYMLEGYKNGITPNPDIMCNKEIKFGLFFEKAMKLGADYIATGHYARLWREIRNSLPTGDLPKGEKSEIRILQAKDKNKDQSYFLSCIKPDVLDRVLFPVGDYTKPEVRMLAKKFGLPNAERKESQGVCFIGKVDFGEFLKTHIPQKEGNIVDKEGNILGRHQGVFLYTLGQRQGIGLSGGPFYVVEKNLRENVLIVSKDERDLLLQELSVKNVNWFSNVKEGVPLEVETRIRYRQAPATSTVSIDSSGKRCTLVFKEPQRAVTPGQLAVFYQGEQMLAGGVIA